MAKGPPFTRISYQDYTRTGAVAHGIAKAVQRSVQWFKAAIQKISGVSLTQEISEEQATTQEQTIEAARKQKLLKPVDHTNIGQMFMFKYDPKWKNRLPYWDEFPLVFPLEMTSGGFLGLNLHYLPTGFRVPILNSLGSLSNSDKYDDDTRLDISYGILKNATITFNRFYKDCVRRYRYDCIRSEIFYVSPSDWDNVAMLPFERWNYKK